MAEEISYISSDQIEVFPAGFRSQEYIKSRLTTEENLIRLKQISSYKELNNYFIEYPPDSNQYIIGLNGYEFIILDSTNIPTSKYAYIKLKNLVGSDGINIKVLDSLVNSENSNDNTASLLDINSQFVGLGFTDVEPTDPDIIFIEIRDGNNQLKLTKLKLSADEIRNVIPGSSTDLPISKHFSPESLSVKYEAIIGQLTAQHVNMSKVASNTPYDIVVKVQNDLKDQLWYSGSKISNNSLVFGNEATINVPEKNNLEIIDTENITGFKLTQENDLPSLIVSTKGSVTHLISDNTDTSGNIYVHAQKNGQNEWIKASAYADLNSHIVITQTDGSINASRFIGYLQGTAQQTKISKAQTTDARYILTTSPEPNANTGNNIYYDPRMKISGHKITLGNDVNNIPEKSIELYQNIEIGYSGNTDARTTVCIQGKKNSRGDNTNTSIIGPSNQTITLPGDIKSNESNMLFRQTSSGESSWIKYSEESINSTIVQRDSTGRIKVSGIVLNNLAGYGTKLLAVRSDGVITTAPDTQITAIKLTNDSISNKKHYLLFANNPSESSENEVLYSNVCYIQGKILNFGIIDDSTQAWYDRQIQLNAKKLIVGKSINEAQNTSIIKIDAPEDASETTIVGPDGIITLPANSTENNVLFRQTSSGESSWIKYSSAESKSTIVQRDSNGYIEGKNVRLSGIAGFDSSMIIAKSNGSLQLATRVQFAASDTDYGFIKLGFAENNSGSVYDSTRVYAVKTNNQGAAYVQVPWSFSLTSATNTQFGGIKLGFAADSSQKKYPVQLNSNGQAFVQVPWGSGTASISPATPSNLGGIKAIRTYSAEQITSADQSSYTAGRMLGVQTDKLGNAFVVLPYTGTGDIGGIKVHAVSSPSTSINSYTNISLVNPLGLISNGASNGAIGYVNLPAASTTILGGVKVSGFTPSAVAVDMYTSGKAYGLSIDGTGKLFLRMGNSSDIRLKENITDFKPQKSILDLPVKKFDFKEGKKNQIGCIAQDLQKICPELVEEDDRGYLTIEENKLVYLLLEEVKALKAEVESLKKKLS